jgi:hypothetical protein
MAYASQTLTAVASATRKSKSRECTRCGGRNYDAGFSYCETCRSLTAAIHAAWRQTHRETGLCTECCVKRQKGQYLGPSHAYGNIYMKCETHLEYHRAWHREHYQEKRKKGLCGYASCQVKTSGFMCDTHNPAKKEKQPHRAATLRLPVRRAIKRAAA